MTLRPPPRYRPGTSPFHARGSAFLGFREYVEARVPGGLAAVIPLLPDDEHRAFIQQVFLPVAWYDALPIRAVSEAAAVAEGVRFADSVRTRANFVAHRDLNGLYKLLLRVITPELALDRLQRISSRYFDFGKTEVIGTTKGASEGLHTGIPEPLLSWFTPTVDGYSTAILELAGAKSPRCRFEPPRRDGDKGGVETFTVRFTFAWTQ